MPVILTCNSLQSPAFHYICMNVKLLRVNSTFAANYQYLSFKFGLTEADWTWYTSLDHLLGKVEKKIALILYPVLL